MIGVHIKKIPENCSVCFARDIAGAGAGLSRCRIAEEALDCDYDKRRMDWCPLDPGPFANAENLLENAEEITVYEWNGHYHAPKHLRVIREEKVKAASADGFPGGKEG